MTTKDFVKKYNMHDSLINSLSYKDNTVHMNIDFAFWMQEWYIDGSPETGILTVEFPNVHFCQCPDPLPLEEISILETACDKNSIKFSLINDMTDEYLEIIIDATEVIVK